ncbi:aquaporin AQPcic [Orussus abietinus]|uniref:aquaporin AQPcic n=1 Tax=Orussus abietinus TaxID=222816 RepID=UPI0006254EE1|nr:aquaporin AQPcic [Orussus abietinus]XP_012288703.1 aquaporin AQPcic [Orussus abietinus]XP_012288704.1 aquaporin AQPcic [Orussus abietinus]
MEQAGISIITPPGIIENSLTTKPKNTTIKISAGNKFQNAKKKFKSSWLSGLFKVDHSAKEIAKMAISEVLGTGTLVLLGCMSCIGTFGTIPTGFTVSIAFGYAVMLCIQCFGHISGAHINPAVTLGSVVLGNTSLVIAFIYIIAQCIGAVVGYGLIMTVTSEEFMLPWEDVNNPPKNSICVTQLHANVTLGQGFLVEVMATFLLMCVACAIWDKRNSRNTDSVAIRFGFSVAVLCIAFGPYTGCSMNPARSLAPAIWNNKWTHHWVYWIGPIIGSFCASILYRCLFVEKEEAKPVEQPSVEGLPPENGNVET